jgi:hypothetical protein
VRFDIGLDAVTASEWMPRHLIEQAHAHNNDRIHLLANFGKWHVHAIPYGNGAEMFVAVMAWHPLPDKQKKT